MYKLRQRVLQGNLIERFDLSTEIFGKKVKSPIGIAPTAMQRMAHPLGEVGAMRAAESRGMVYGLSTLSNTKLEQVATEAPTVPKIMQLYYFKTEKKNKEFL